MEEEVGLVVAVEQVEGLATVVALEVAGVLVVVVA